MIRAALEYLRSVVDKANEPTQLTAGDGSAIDPRRVHFAIGGQIHTIDRPPTLRHHRVGRLDDLAAIALLDHWRGDTAPTAAGYNGPVVWHCESDVTLILDDADRRDQVTMMLHPTAAFLALKAIAGKLTPLPQADFVRMLRLTLGLDPALIQVFRKLDWSHGTERSGEVKHGTDRMGVAVRSECSGVSDLPEELVVPASVYSDQGLDKPVSIACNVDIDAAGCRIVLMPKPRAIELAVQAAQANIRSQLIAALGDAEIPVYYGSP